MRKGWGILLLSALLASTLTACSAGQDNRGYYEQAQLYLGSGDYDAARSYFEQLGEYDDAADYALYCAGLAALRDGDRALARADFEQVKPFKSSERYLRYLDALALEEDGQDEAALRLWEALGSFEDSVEHAARLRESIPNDALEHARALMDAGRYEQAKALLESLDGWGDSAALIADCDEALTRAAYDRAEALYAQGQFAEAMSAFEALGDSLDAAQRARDCRAAMYDGLEAARQRATLSTADDLMAGYEEMEDYRDSEERLAALHARYDTPLRLLKDVKLLPWVSFGQFPTQTSGAPSPLKWRLLSVDGSTATLLCDAVIDALPATALPELMLTANEQEALVSLTLPTHADLTGLSDEDLIGTATPYAAAQGVRHLNDGRAWWWLGDPADNGRNAIVWYNGKALDTGVSATAATVGERPLLRVNLDVLLLNGGDGTPESPYRFIPE